MIARLHKETLAALALPEVRDFFAKQGADVVTTSPLEFAAIVKTERARWGAPTCTSASPAGSPIGAYP